jgi:hypothetical protein
MPATQPSASPTWRGRGRGYIFMSDIYVHDGSSRADTHITNALAAAVVPPLWLCYAVILQELQPRALYRYIDRYTLQYSVSTVYTTGTIFFSWSALHIDIISTISHATSRIFPPPFSAGRVDFPAFERWYFPVHSVHLQLLKPCKFNECRERERERLIESFIMRSHTAATQTAIQHISIYPGTREERGRSSRRSTFFNCESHRGAEGDLSNRKMGYEILCF